MRALAAVAAVVVLLFLPLPVPEALRNWPTLLRDVENAVHPLLFGGLTLVLINSLGVEPGRNPRFVWLLVGLVVLALLTEGIQGLLGRDATWSDIGNDLLGAGVALLLVARNRSADQRPFGRAHLFALAAAPLALIALLPLALTLVAYVARSASSPVLWSDESRLLNRFSWWKLDRYPGLVIDEPLRDWRAFSALQIKVRRECPDISRIIVRVHDRRHDQRYSDRYNASLDLADDAEHTLKIPAARIRDAPAGRQMDMGAIRGIVIFQDGGERLCFHVHEVRLVP